MEARELEIMKMLPPSGRHMAVPPQRSKPNIKKILSLLGLTSIQEKDIAYSPLYAISGANGLIWNI